MSWSSDVSKSDVMIAMSWSEGKTTMKDCTERRPQYDVIKTMSNYTCPLWQSIPDCLIWIIICYPTHNNMPILLPRQANRDATAS